ncbi:TIGR02444 family protein [Caenispirillum bisanense]|uniref:TIGR02444 family protein n=1 Tax=Caenispirillum bisanense TaxID=414052 RepID=A0A286H1E9_9PROT|nr:TIGR02444 family protein [Caenispirillum bisanense]SOE01286.1 TIGR02444 family protein [Caenispirillum bisanense]
MPNPMLADHAFWRFSLDRYGRPGVAEACLALQDRRGADVNVVLLVLWQAEQGRGLAESTLSAVLAASRDWQAQVVGPVRAARRAAKRAAEAGDAAAAALYPRLKEAELACEHAEQTALAALVPAEAAGPPDRRAAELGLRAYLATLPGGPAAQEVDWLAVLVTAVSPAASHPR